jgi:hypothetical protein
MMEKFIEEKQINIKKSMSSLFEEIHIVIYLLFYLKT